MGLHQNMLNEPVSRLALREPVLCKPEDTLREAIKQMQQAKLGCVIVVDEQSKPVGMFTENRLTQLLTKGPAPLDDAISTQLDENWPCVQTTDPVVDVLNAMQSANVRFICVCDEQGRVTGLTGQKGLMEFVADHFPGQVMVQRVGCAPYLDREGA